METTDKLPRDLAPVLHINMIEGDNPRIFCKKRHALKKLSELECGSACEYFRGTGQGDTIQCEWEDFPRLSGSGTRIIRPADQTREFRAVSAYIDDGLLKKG